MILEIEVLAVLALQAVALRSRTPKCTEMHGNARPAEAPSLVAQYEMQYEILKRVGNTWAHIGHRHAGHPDIDEALNTPGLAIRHADGSIHEGRQ